MQARRVERSVLGVPVFVGKRKYGIYRGCSGRKAGVLRRQTMEGLPRTDKECFIKQMEEDRLLWAGSYKAFKWHINQGDRSATV